MRNDHEAVRRAGLPKLHMPYLSFDGGADGSMQLIQLVLQFQLVGFAVPRAAVQETGGPVPGLLPAPRGVLPAGLQHICHVTKKLLLQALHALLYLMEHTLPAVSKLATR